MIVVADTSGRLGNQLLVYAHAAALALEAGTTLHNVVFEEAADLFVGTQGTLTARFPRRAPQRKSFPRAFRRAVYWSVKILIAVAWRARLRDTKLWTLRRSPWGTRLDLGEEEIVAHARRSKVMTLQGWGLRSERLLQKHAVTIRQHLRPLPEVEDRVQQLIPKAASNADALIGVHVRRTDYAEWCRGRFFFGADVYQRVVDQMAGLFPGKKVAFLVTSDDLDEASLIRGETVTLARGSLLEDLFSLAECDYIVGPPSTFSYWASFYGSTPLYPIVDPDKEILLEDFAVAPEFADADLEEPFWPDQWTERPELT